MAPKDELYNLKYPIGEFVVEPRIDAQMLEQWMTEITLLPEKVRTAVDGLSELQLGTPYRPGGWTIKQVIHHLGDSHLNSYIRFKWALTEHKPTIKAYDEKKWARLAEYDLLDVETSLQFLELLHKRLVILLKSITPEELEREFIHPETGKAINLKRNIGLYAWHGKHHTAHITSLRQRKNW
ncbi:MAG: putative metal-dependent hydrolase [Calditrichaeota bacterium]|nr:MAG: putative metal-dependent hydrolase [Calditrichota bacterium]